MKVWPPSFEKRMLEMPIAGSKTQTGVRLQDGMSRASFRPIATMLGSCASTARDGSFWASLGNARGTCPTRGAHADGTLARKTAIVAAPRIRRDFRITLFLLGR